MERQAHPPLTAPTAAAAFGAPISGATLSARFERLVDQFDVAISDPVAAHRLKSYDLDAVIRMAGAEHLELWCLFHGEPSVSRAADGHTAEIEVTISPALLDDFWDRHLAMEMLRGNVTHRGQVRRLLTIMPVLRAAVRRYEGTEGRDEHL